jgi:16S rRNA processing protein RimM
LSPGTVLSTPSGPLHVEAARPSGGDRWIVWFEGSTDRTSAERLQGLELSAEAMEVPGTLWVHELVGASVRDTSGVVVGRVAAVEANPASDLLVLESGALIPLNFVTGHDAAGGTVDVDIPEGLLDL